MNLKDELLDFNFSGEVVSKLDTREKIHGMLGKYSGYVLYNASRLTKETVVEVGCFKGKSTSFLALGQNKNIYTIDPFAMDLSLEYIFLANMKNLGIENVKQVKGHAESVPLGFMEGKKIGLFFYDGDHDTDLTNQTIKRFEPYFVDGCLVLLDDIEMGPVTKTLEWLLSRGNYELVFKNEKPDSMIWHFGFCVLRYSLPSVKEVIHACAFS